MLTTDFHFELPAQLIAQTPLPQRSASRLLMCDVHAQRYHDRLFGDFIDALEPGDLLVFNDTRVIPARLYGEKKYTGGKIEILVERLVGHDRALCHIKASKAPVPGTQLLLAGEVEATVVARDNTLFLLTLNSPQNFAGVLEQFGSIPLPPYIDRPVDSDDASRYQTLYANVPGAVAAPTAGLHFDQSTLDALTQKGIDTAFVTLHVGAGTFQPVRVADPEQHTMHAERVEVSAAVCEKIAATRARKGRVVAVGTTVVRSLETATDASGIAKPFSGETAIFIKPGYSFRCIDALMTNFHLPESTLLMLVCAFGGYDFMMGAYRHAVASGYRFFSYGDAMFIQSRNLSGFGTRSQQRQ